MSMRLSLVCGVAVLLAAPVSDAPAVSAQEPVLKSVVVKVRTHDDDKDNDTTLQVWTTLPGGRFAISGETYSCDNSGCRFPDHTDRDLQLKPDGAYVKSLFVRGFTTHMSITTNGDDSWRFTARTVLTFSDGSTLERHGAATELNEERRYYTF